MVFTVGNDPSIICDDIENATFAKIINKKGRESLT